MMLLFGERLVRQLLRGFFLGGSFVRVHIGETPVIASRLHPTFAHVKKKSCTRKIKFLKFSTVKVSAMTEPELRLQVCTQGWRCRSKNHPLLTDDNFRKGTNPPNCDAFYKTCNFCRNTNPCSKASPPMTPKKWCSHCETTRWLVYFMDDNGIG